MIKSSSPLPLDTRAGIPDAMAVLRSDYPRAGWNTHRNFGQMSAFWLGTHEQLRQEAQYLAKLTQAFRNGGSDARVFQQAFVPRFNHFLAHLNGHHHIEDQAYFPKFRALDPRMAAGFDLLESDHDAIHASLGGVLRAGQTLMDGIARGPDQGRRAADAYADDADGLTRLMLRHLADEEDIIIPAMLHHGERRVS